ncbi:unnamed protein product [Gongylonema pulchrum]|uniref:Secreted protein n=1 Tax=Gongylonema pulchrum TaxID=637853 RepID=A0A183D8S9_9BILA|nr:unnamed protein product [Gongylonema pulchrum]
MLTITIILIITALLTMTIIILSMARESNAQSVVASASPVAFLLRRASLSRTVQALSKFRSNLSAFEAIAQSLTPQLPSRSRRRKEAGTPKHRRARSLGPELFLGEINLSFPVSPDWADSEGIDLCLLRRKLGSLSNACICEAFGRCIHRNKFAIS